MTRLPTQQRGAATLFVALAILGILTIILLASSSMALFEQKTSNNEARQRLAEQAAEYALNLGGEFFKANISKVSSTQVGGWRNANPGVRWVPCATFTVSGGAFNPCLAEPNPTRRGDLWVYVNGGSTEVPYESMITNTSGNEGTLDSVGVGAVGTGFDANQTKVYAVMCLINSPPGQTSRCKQVPDPNGGNNIAITVIARSTLAGENAAAEIKETWGTFSSFSVSSAMPLVAAGIVQGLGNATIVAAPNAGGFGVPGSIWSPKDVDIDDAGSGVGAVTTCHMGDYLGNVDVSALKATCSGSGNTGCGCDANGADASYLSGHGGPGKRENIDILDVDGDANDVDDTYRDIQFFPGVNASNVQMDDPTVATDDSLFEWIFNKDIMPEGTTNTPQTCTTSVAFGSSTDCAVAALESMNAQVLATCGGLSAASEGLYYITGACDLPAAVGSPTKNVIVVANSPVTVGGNSVFFGMLFIHSANNTATFTGNGNPKIFGAVVVEGNVNITGGIDIIYTDMGTKSPGDPLPESTKFGRLSGSWFDNRQSF